MGVTLPAQEYESEMHIPRQHVATGVSSQFGSQAKLDRCCSDRLEILTPTESTRSVECERAIPSYVAIDVLFTDNQIYIPKSIAKAPDVSSADALLFGRMYRTAGESDSCRARADHLAVQVGMTGERRGRRRVETRRKDGCRLTDVELAAEAKAAYIRRHTANLRKQGLIANIPRGPKPIDRRFLKHNIYGHVGEEQAEPFAIFGNTYDQRTPPEAWGLPVEIARDSTLTPGEKMTCAILGAYGRKHNNCHPGQKLISTALGCSVESVKIYLRGLRRKRIIAVHKPGKHNVYRFLYRDVYATRIARVNGARRSPATDQTVFTPVDQTVFTPIQPPQQTLVTPKEEVHVEEETHKKCADDAEPAGCNSKPTRLERPTDRAKQATTNGNALLTASAEEIIAYYERWTRNRASSTDRTTATSLASEFPINAIKIGILLCIFRCPTTIHSLKYCAEEVERSAKVPLPHSDEYIRHVEKRLINHGGAPSIGRAAMTT